MNKILVPSLLTATILIAGIFAIVDVDRVMAAHLPVLGSAQISTDSITAAELANNAVDTAAVLDDAVTQAKLAPNSVGDTAALPQDTLANALLDTAFTTSITPAVISTALVWCTASITPTGHAITDLTYTITETSTNGVIQGTTAVVTGADIADGAEGTITGQWAVTGIDDAVTFKCVVGGTGPVDGDVDLNNLFVIFLPQ